MTSTSLSVFFAGIKNNYYKNFTILFLIITFLNSCSTDNKAKLDKLKKQKSEIETQIAALEDELKKTDTSSVTDKSTEVSVMPLATQFFKTFIEVQGRVDAEESVSLSSEMPGTINKINVSSGDNVFIGQVLAETDTRVIQQQLQDLEINYELAKQVFVKQENLWNQKIGTEIQFLQAKTTKESLEKKISMIQEQLKMSKIISPINGTVDGVNVKIGQPVFPGMAAISVVNFSKLKVKAEVAESYASKIKNGNEVLLVFPDMNDSVSSKVKYASRTINALSRTFVVEVALESKKEFHPNMVAKLKINDYQSSAPLIVIPIKFIQKTTNDSFVMIAENGKVVNKKISMGKQYNGNAEILSGLNAGDLLITQGYDLVYEGDKIIIKK